MLTEAQVFNGFGCNGENLSPAAEVGGRAQRHQELRVTVYDPDAPTGSGWWHWVVYNIPADAKELPRAPAADGKAASRRRGAGPHRLRRSGLRRRVPASGRQAAPLHLHRLRAEDGQARRAADATAALIGFMTNANKLGRATFTAKYGRSK